MHLSIIIPTHERADILKQCIDHIDAQTIADKLEVIVVSDGHDAKTAALFENPTWHVSVRFFEIEKSQQGVARNRGVQEASSSLCLFIGDDIFLAPDACEKHLDAHKLTADRYPLIAILGFTTWDPALGINEVMHWLEKSGWQFGYPKIQKYAHDFIPKEKQHLFTYTSHLSLPTEIAREHPFRVDVSMYGWEDIAWGKELAEAGVRLYYEPDANAHHHHSMTLEESLNRMETLGRSVTNFPDLDRTPKGWKKMAYEVAALLPTMAGRHRRAFLKGMKNPSKWA